MVLAWKKLYAMVVQLPGWKFIVVSAFPAETNGRDDTEQVGILVIQERDYIHREKRELPEKENRRRFMEGRHSLNRYWLYPNTSGSPNDF